MRFFRTENHFMCFFISIKKHKWAFTTIFVDTRLWKTKHPRKRFQDFRQSCVLLTDRVEIHQLQPPVRPSNLLYVMLWGCDWCISIRSVNNTQDWRKFWKRFRRCLVLQSRVSTKMVVNAHLCFFIDMKKFPSCVDNTLRDLPNSFYPTQTHLIIANYNN